MTDSIDPRLGHAFARPRPDGGVVLPQRFSGKSGLVDLGRPIGDAKSGRAEQYSQK
jgi:hypothetical protein